MSQATTSPRLRPFKPARFGRYTLLMPISTGGMGEVFLARLEGAHGFDKLCVIKKILPHLAEDQEFVERFVDEARILVKLSHGSIAQVLDMGLHEGAPYLALEFVDGKDLRRVAARMRDRKLSLPLSFVLFAMTRVLDALAYAHRKRGDDDRELSLVHRDVSPQNVLISYEGEVKMIDFGLAKSTLSSSKTNPSIILGKFLYMSPEQARHQKVDRRSDLYAVGVVLYELVAGKNPFDAVQPGELMAAVASPSIRPLHEAEPLCPAPLSAAVMKALSADPAQRFQSAEEFRATLQALLLELDPGAGSEKASRFMREAFAVEYHAERRMLQSVRDQAKQVAEETSSTGEGLRAVESTAPSGLSFEPTKKKTPAMSASLDFERETVPAIVMGTEATPPASPPGAPAPPRTLPKSRDDEPTDALGQALTPAPAAAEPSVVVADGLKPLLASPAGRLRTEPEVKAAEPKARSTPPRAAPKDKPRPTGQRQAVPRPAAKPEPKPAKPAAKPVADGAPTPPTELPAVQGKAVEPAASPAAAKKKSGILIWLVLPLVGVLTVAGYIAWDLYAERLRQKALDEESAREATPPARPEERKSREVKVGAEARPPEPEDIAPLPKEKEPKKKSPAPAPKQPAIAAASTPAEKAFRSLKADYEKLEQANETLVKQRFRMRFNIASGKVASKGDDPAFLRDLEALDAEIQGELARPENQ